MLKTEDSMDGLALRGTLWTHPCAAYPRRPTSKYPLKANPSIEPSWPHHVSHYWYKGKSKRTNQKIRKSNRTQALALFSVFDFALDFDLPLPVRNVMEVGRWSGVVCLARGISRQDAEDERARDGLAASPARWMTPDRLPALKNTTFEHTTIFFKLPLW